MTTLKLHSCGAGPTLQLVQPGLMAAWCNRCESAHVYGIDYESTAGAWNDACELHALRDAARSDGAERARVLGDAEEVRRVFDQSAKIASLRADLATAVRTAEVSERERLAAQDSRDKWQAMYYKMREAMRKISGKTARACVLGGARVDPWSVVADIDSDARAALR